MTRKSTATTHFTLLEELQARTRLSGLQLAAAVGLVLFLLLVGVAYLTPFLARYRDDDAWWQLVWYEGDNPAMIFYLLLFQPTVRRLRDGAIRALRPLANMDDADFDHRVADGADAARFVTELARHLADPNLLLLDT